MARCIVCAAALYRETQVDEDQAEQEGMFSVYQGRTYYFDSMEHKKMFDQDPERYLKIARERGMAA